MNLHIDKMQYQKKNILKGAVIFLGLIIFYSACEDSPILRQRLDCAPAPASMEIVPQPLSTVDSTNWTLGPYTQGTLHFTVHERPTFLKLKLFNRQKDSTVLDLVKVLSNKDISAYPFQLAIRWNTDAGLINIMKNDELWLQRTLPFYDDLGVHSLKTALINTTLDSLTNESLIQDPADIKIAYWGNGLDPDERENSVNRPWDAQLTEMTHSQGVFLRIKGDIQGIFEYNYSSPIRKLTPELKKLLSQRPDFMIVSAGSIEESFDGGGYLPTFRQEMTEALTLITAAGVQPIILTLPPVAENAPLKAKDLRGAYNRELRTVAVDNGASVIDLADRFRDPANADKVLMVDAPQIWLSQAGHDVLAQELSTLIQYYIQFGGRN